jgi:cell division protein FtsB
VTRNKNNRDWRLWSRQLTVLLCCVSTTGYFAYHAINGRHGFEARARLIERSNVLEFEIKSLEAVRAHLVRDIALLAPNVPEADIIDELARDVLGFSFPGERILRR